MENKKTKFNGKVSFEDKETIKAKYDDYKVNIVRILSAVSDRYFMSKRFDIFSDVEKTMYIKAYEWRLSNPIDGRVMETGGIHTTIYNQFKKDLN